MAVNFWWDDEAHTIIRIDVQAGTTWTEYHDGLNKVMREVTAAGHRVDLIMQVLGDMPPGNPLHHVELDMHRMASTPNLGAVMVVGKDRVSAFAQRVVNLALRLYRRDTPAKSGFPSSIEEARAIIMKLREG